MPFYNGQWIDEETQQGGTDAGIAGALAAMSRTSGDNYQGFAPWLSSAVAGLYGGRENYMADAAQRARQFESDRMAKEDRDRRISAQDAEAEAAQRHREMLSSLLADEGLTATGDDAFDERLYLHSQELKEKQAEQERIVAGGSERGLHLTGIEAFDKPELEHFYDQKYPKPPSEMTAYQNWEKSRAEDQDAEKKGRAIALWGRMTPEEQAIVPSPYSGGVAEDYEAIINGRGAMAPDEKAFATARAKALAESNKPFTPYKTGAPKPDVAKTVRYEDQGILPPNVSKATPTTGAPPTPRSDVSKFFPTDAEVQSAIRAVSIPPAYSLQPGFAEKMRDAIAANRRAGMDPKAAQAAAVAAARESFSRLLFGGALP